MKAHRLTPEQLYLREERKRERTHLRQKMDEWARWRIYKRPGGYGKLVIAKLLDGMPSTKCTMCQGKGKVPGWKVKVSAPFIHCPQCSGDGRIKAKSTVNKINPAMIRSTYREPDNPDCETIDRLVCELRQSDKTTGQYLVIWAEYCDKRGGTQEIKARRMNITHEYYRKLLERGHDMIEKGL